MARPPLVLETWGKIRRTTIDGQPTAVAYYRDSDGVTRKAQRKGRTPAEAERLLVAALKERLSPSDGITGSTRVADLAEAWWAEFSASDKPAPNTRRRYRETLDRHIIRGLGGVLIQEATVSRLDRFVKAKTVSSGYAAAKLCVVVLSGMFNLAARHDAVRSSPMKSVAPVPTPQREIQAFTIEDAAEVRSLLRAWDSGTDKRGMARTSDLGDPIDMYLATGGRTGEILALRWDDIDLKATPPTVTISGTVTRAEKGLHVQPHPKSNASHRSLKLPPFAVDMLIRRRVTSHSEYVFPSSTGTLRAPSNFLLQWHAALKGSRFEGAVPKTFRSSVATIVADRADSRRAQEQLGHGTLAVTERHYIKRATDGPDVTAILELFNVLSESSE